MLNKDNKVHNCSQISINESVRGSLSRESYTLYSALCKKRKKRVYIIPLLITSAAILIASAFICAHYIAEKKDSEDNKNSYSTSSFINAVTPNIENLQTIKVEVVTNEISDVFNIPVGLRIIELNDKSSIFHGLNVNDIVVTVSGYTVCSISEMMNVIRSLGEEDPLIYNIYRNGEYHSVGPLIEIVDPKAQ